MTFLCLSENLVFNHLLLSAERQRQPVRGQHRGPEEARGGRGWVLGDGWGGHGSWQLLPRQWVHTSKTASWATDHGKGEFSFLGRTFGCDLHERSFTYSCTCRCGSVVNHEHILPSPWPNTFIMRFMITLTNPGETQTPRILPDSAHFLLELWFVLDSTGGTHTYTVHTVTFIEHMNVYRLTQDQSCSLSLLLI